MDQIKVEQLKVLLKEAEQAFADSRALYKSNAHGVISNKCQNLCDQALRELKAERTQFAERKLREVQSLDKKRKTKNERGDHAFRLVAKALALYE